MELRNVSIAHMISKLSKRIQVEGEFARLDGPWAIDVSSVVIYRYIYTMSFFPRHLYVHTL